MMSVYFVSVRYLLNSLFNVFSNIYLALVPKILVQQSGNCKKGVEGGDTNLKHIGY